MGETQAGRAEFACAGCGKRYAWKPALAGRRVRCGCGATMTCPAAAPAADEETYDFAPMRVEAIPEPVPAPVASLAYRAPKEEVAVRGDTERIRDIRMPLWILTGGVVVEVVAGLIHRRSFEAAMLHVGVNLIFGTVVMVAGMMVAAKMRGLVLGNFWNVVFKLSAIAIAPTALVSLLMPGLIVLFCIGYLIALALAFVLYFALIGALFDLDQGDTWYCVIVIFCVNVMVSYGLRRAIETWT
jgi:hypothetical protein